jgi:hypothetical protein
VNKSMLTYLAALMMRGLTFDRKAPDIHIPDSKADCMRLLELDRINRAKFPSRKKRMKARKP